jgi:leucyl aminopeptidase (aminopeptidase T)
VTIERSLDSVLVDCLDVKPGENVLVVTDPARSEIAKSLVERARALGADAVLAEMSERESNGAEPAAAVAGAMLSSDVVMGPTSKSFTHTDARKAASESGVRVATMPGITADVLIRTMGADFAQVRRRSAAVTEALSEGTEVHIAGPSGTDLTLSVAGRAGISDDGDIRTPGAFGNLPAGESFVAPVEGSANGTIAFDGSIWPLGKLEEPLFAEVESGYAKSFTGKAPDEFRATLEPYGTDAFAVAELGIGTNEAARLTGNVLEDEKILGTIHVAFGDNHSFGGTIRVASHQDGVVLDASVEIDGKVLMEAGRLGV